MYEQQTACAFQSVIVSRRCAKLINVRKYKVWCGCLLIGRVPKSFWDATFQHIPCLCVYMIAFAVSSIQWRKIEVKTVKLIKSKTRGKFAITGRSSQFVHAFGWETGLFFLSVDLYFLYISSCSLPIFLFLQPRFLIYRSYIFTNWRFGALAHSR